MPRCHFVCHNSLLYCLHLCLCHLITVLTLMTMYIGTTVVLVNINVRKDWKPSNKLLKHKCTHYISEQYITQYIGNDVNSLLLNLNSISPWRIDENMKLFLFISRWGWSAIKQINFINKGKKVVRLAVYQLAPQNVKNWIGVSSW